MAQPTYLSPPELGRHDTESCENLEAREQQAREAVTVQLTATPSTPVRRALITGITGQDGAYLTELLLAKGYEVHGIIRRSSSFNTGRIDHLYRDRHETGVRLYLHYGDLTDGTSLTAVLGRVKPAEVYNLAAMSHVHVSFDEPEYTAQADGVGVLHMLDAMRVLELAGFNPEQARLRGHVASLSATPGEGEVRGREGAYWGARFYQASTSELYGKVREIPQTETTPFYPRSPYAVAKQYAYWMVVNYREAFGMHATNGILFNHESPRRGPTFVTRKITRAVARIHRGLQQTLYLGNLDSKRDWGHARDYVEGMWRMLQQDEPDDYVLATGETHSVREFVERAFAAVGMEIAWVGERGSVSERGVDARDPDRVLVSVDARYFRPTEVDLLLGSPEKARRVLGWERTVTFPELVEEMVRADVALVDAGKLND